MKRILPPVLLFLAAASLDAADWKVAGNPLTTPWTGKVDPAHPLPEYPRPQLVRSQWVNLNGLWDYAVTPASVTQAPDKFEGPILVPFAIESALSGVKRALQPDQKLWYRRTFPVPQSKRGRVLLHFGAVDWSMEAWINGKSVGRHTGGYDPFTFDVTSALSKAGDQTLVVAVTDPTNTGTQPRGKQILNPNGIWYTAVSGIWQTVWLESVPRTYIDRLVLNPDLDAQSLRIRAEVGGPPGSANLNVRALLNGKVVGQAKGPAGRELVLKLSDVQTWSPDHPTLYDLEASLDGGDSVKSYFGMRKVEVRKMGEAARLFLNNQPVFLIGPLDQGWWPDGLYTAPTDEALKFDIEMTRKLGFNMARKHVKVEPARWYYWCDKLGLAVWQDMPSGFSSGEQNVKPKGEKDAMFDAHQAGTFLCELEALVKNLQSVPSILVWVPFNEGWGQHDTNSILQHVRKLDPGRLVDAPSGWEDRGWGDFKDMHKYPGPDMFPTMPDRVTVLGEFGGLGLPVEGHLWWNKRNWGYRTFQDLAALQAGYEDLIVKLRPLVAAGLSAAVYTQTTDVEGEVNGLMTYDRKLVKFDAARLAPLHSEVIRAGSAER